MNTTMASVGFNQEAFDAFLETRNEPGWLIDLRRQAWATFMERDLPSRKEEEWMRTDIRLFKLDRFGIPSGSDEGSSARGVLNSGVELGGSSSSVNGRPQQAEVDKRWTDKGVIFGSLATIAQQHPDLIEKYLFQKAIDPHFDIFSALHAACWTSGTVLYVPRGVVVDQPFYAQSTIADGGVDLGHTLVVLEDGAEATLLNENGAAPSQTTTGLFIAVRPN